jgi:hypothetical protein
MRCTRTVLYQRAYQQPLIGIVDAVQRHVHRADPQHGAVEIKPVEHLLVEMIAGLFLLKDLRMIVAEIFVRRDEEAAGATGRSTMMSFGPGAIIMWRGVRNWPFWPALAIFDSMYS